MPNLLLVAHTSNGKTHILKRFLRKHPASDNLGADAILLPVIFVQAPPYADEVAFYDAILSHFATPIRPRDHVRNKRSQAIGLLRAVGTKMLIIDEIQHLLAGDSTKRGGMLNSIKYLGNELEISIVASGIETAFNAIQTDAQIANRFQPFALGRWKNDEAWRSLLASFEMIFPLKKASDLSADEIGRRLWEMSEGLIGEMCDILGKAGKQAIETSTECITLSILNKLDWIPPSQRRRKAETLLEG